MKDTAVEFRHGTGRKKSRIVDTTKEIVRKIFVVRQRKICYTGVRFFEKRLFPICCSGWIRNGRFFICSLQGHLLCSGQFRRSDGLLAPASVFRYDDLLEFYLSGAELVLPEQFHIEVLLTETLDDLATFLLARYARENLRYRKCKFCGRYFGVVRNYKSEYCDRLIDGSTKTCKDSGALRLYEKRKLENPAVKEYKRSYKAHNARIRYGLMTREEFQAWSKEARQNRDRCVAGELSLEEFVAWLDSDRQ